MDVGPSIGRGVRAESGVAMRGRLILWAACLILASISAHASYVNFESSHVHPIARTPDGQRLLAVNTPDAMLEVFIIEADGSLTPERAIAVGLEPVTVVARTSSEAWVVNHLSDTVSIVDLVAGTTTRTLFVGDEPTDVAFTQGRAFVAISQEDVVKVFNLANLNVAPTIVPLFGRDVRALAVSLDGSRVYATVLRSGNQTTLVTTGVIFPGSGALNFDAARLTALNLRNLNCTAPPPPYPPLPAGIQRNPALTDPPDGLPKVSLIVRWDEGAGKWLDDAGQDWTHCLPYRLPDRDLFSIDATTLAVTSVSSLGTTLFDVSVQPGTGRVWVPNTDARNHVRFEHPLGVQGHVVENQLSVVDPGAGNSVTRIDLNAHIDRGSSPATNLAQRQASISQPGMMTWSTDGSRAWLTAIGSRKLFQVDGTCQSAACIFGANRAAPEAVEVGEGPTGVVFDEARDRLYVLNRISHSLAVVEASTLSLIAQRPLHDPSPAATREGRRFLYDGIDSSRHGDAACSSCHISGDMDGLAWDLGNPAGVLAPYSLPNDNVRFVIPVGGNPVECLPSQCASHAGFDPQKGPMTTQTLRGMLEPLHWRGDRATMNDFNGAFVDLMGTLDIGPVNGHPAGLTATDMEKFRQFSLATRFPPNPYRNIDDTMPCGLRSTDPGCEVLVHGSLFPGNPTEGQRIFDVLPTDAGQPCRSCHTHPFGAGGGKLGGVTPSEPTSVNAAALFNGNADGSPHSDLKIPHLRNMYEKFGPVWAPPAGAPVNAKVGFGLTHDGSLPDLFRFFSVSVFNLSAANQAQQVRDISAFMFFFPTDTKPAVGRQVTLPAGTPPTGSPADEDLLGKLTTLGDLNFAGRHCDLVASALVAGELRYWRWAGGAWLGDEANQPPLSMLALRQGASGPITFLCGTIGSGLRLGGDRDEDAVFNADDCAPDDAGSWGEPTAVTSLRLAQDPVTTLIWDPQAAVAGPGLRFDVLGGELSVLRASGIAAATSCLESDLEPASWEDAPDPAPGAGRFYLVRAVNACGAGDLGPGREPIQGYICP